MEQPRHSRAASVTSERQQFDLPTPQQFRPPRESGGRVQDWIANTSYSQAPDTASVYSDSVSGYQTYHRDNRGRPGRVSRQSSSGEEDRSSVPGVEKRRSSGTDIRDPTAAIQQIMKQSQAAIENIMRASGSTQSSAQRSYPGISEVAGTREGYGYYGQDKQKNYEMGMSLRDHDWQNQRGPHRPASVSGQPERTFQASYAHRSLSPSGEPHYLQETPSYRQTHAPAYGDHEQYIHHQPHALPPNAYQHSSMGDNTRLHQAGTAHFIPDSRPSSDPKMGPYSRRRGSAELQAESGNPIRRVVSQPQPPPQGQPQQPMYLPLTPISPNTRPPLSSDTVVYPASPQTLPSSGQTPYSRNTPPGMTPSLSNEYAPRGEEPDYFARKEDAAHSIIMPVNTSGESDAGLMGALRQRQLHVLVVEDNALCQRVVTQILKKIGCTVETANDGIEAVKKWDAIPVEYGNGGWDVILMDIRMPNMDGISATRVLREKGCRVPVIAVTAERGEAERHLCEAVGMVSFCYFLKVSGFESFV